MHGVPGIGLSHKTKDRSFRAGFVGEETFCKALSVTTSAHGGSLLDRLTTVWSINMPSAKDISCIDTKYNTDIDCVLLTRRSICLIDVKLYQGGALSYRVDANDDPNKLYAVDIKTGVTVGKTRTMTNNMSMAVDRFKRHFRNLGFSDLNVLGMVVLIPSDRGETDIRDVNWPGNIEFLHCGEALQTFNDLLSLFPISDIEPDPGVVDIVKKLQIGG